MDARLTTEQRQLRDVAAELAADLGPGSVRDLDDADRVARLEKAVMDTGWRTLRSDGASGVEVALVTEEFARGLVDVPFLGPVLADDLLRDRPAPGTWTLAVGGVAFDTRGRDHAVFADGDTLTAADITDPLPSADLTRTRARVTRAHVLGPVPEPDRHHALALVTTCADLLGAARGAHALACDYARVRTQYGRTVGSYQAVSHPLAEGLALIEGSISVLRYAAWAVDACDPHEAVRAAKVAKVYCARASRTVCETAIQVHGGIGNTWECLAHVYLRRALTATELFPVRLEEIGSGLR